MRRIFIASIFIFIFSIFANGQGAVSYRFLEVVDYANKPVADAKVKVEGSCVRGEQKTNQQGWLEKGFPIDYGDCQTYGFKISKDGYFSFADFFGVTDTISASSENEPTKVELLKIPNTKAERKAIGKEQFKREFFVAARNGDILTVHKFLKAGFSPNLTTSDLRGVPGFKDVPIILFAVSSRDFAMINEFLSAGVNVTKIPNILISYLNADPYLGNYNESEQITKNRKIYEDVFENLVKKGASIRARGTSGMIAGNELTTLMIVAYHGYPRTVKFLIDKGVSVNANDDLARTALIHAVMSPYLKSKNVITELLLQAGADPNVVAEDANPRYGSYCESPLMYSVLNGDAETVRLLIKYKAEVNLGCKNGRNALTIAREQKKYGYVKNADEIIKILEAAGTK